MHFYCYKHGELHDPTCHYCDGTATVPANETEFVKFETAESAESGSIQYTRGGGIVDYGQGHIVPKESINVIVFKWKTEGYRSQFTAEHVNVFASMLSRHTTVAYQLYCITDDADGLDSSIQPVELWPCPVPAYGTANGNTPNCFRRLRMFSDELSEVFGPRWMWSDLDCVILGNIDHILTDENDFRIWRPDGGQSKCNGSLVTHRAGTRPEIWDDFQNGSVVGTVDEFRAQTNHLGSDQAWIGSRLGPDDYFWEQRDGVYAFRALRNHSLERFMAKQAKAEHRAPRTANRYSRDVARKQRRSERWEKRQQERLEAPLPPNARLVYFPGQQHPWDANVQKMYPWVEYNWK